jgi:hypothetical protein
MLGLSSGDTSNSYESMDYALYADPGASKTFVIYESSQHKRNTRASEPSAALIW